jgi:predicted small secreted protein
MTIKVKAVMLLVLFFSTMLITGCQTIKGIGKGGSEGIKKDWQAIMGADDKMREVLW